MKASDHSHILFIIDDLHTALAAGNGLVEQIGALKHARLLLTTRPIDKTLRGPRPESYFGTLKHCTYDVTITKDDTEDFVSLFLRGRTLKDKSTTITRGREFAAGDLHLLDYFTEAYSETAQGIDEFGLLSDIYARYTDKTKCRVHHQTLCRCPSPIRDTCRNVYP